ncbi:MAG: DUF3343 domain-containing protein [Bacillota bacterium]
MEKAGVFTFASVYLALRAEKVVQQAGVPGELIAVPRVLSSSCQGLGLSVPPELRERVAALLRETGILFEKNVLLSRAEL